MVIINVVETWIVVMWKESEDKVSILLLFHLLLTTHSLTNGTRRFTPLTTSKLTSHASCGRYHGQANIIDIVADKTICYFGNIGWCNIPHSSVLTFSV